MVFSDGDYCERDCSVSSIVNRRVGLAMTQHHTLYM